MDSIGNHWGYAMPVDAAATRSLEQICGELVGFENRFLDEYLDHAREVLAGPPSAEGPWLTAELAEHMTGLDTARLAQRAAAGELAVNVTDGRERFRLPDFAQLYALQQLRRVVYPPELVMPTLERAIATGGTEVAEAARDTALWVRYCAAAADTGLGTGASQSPQRSRQ
jgi:hypothetical protein